MTVLHQRSLTYKHTPPPFSFPVAFLSRSSQVGHPNPSTNVPRSETELSNHVSAIMQSSQYSFKWVVLARSSSIFRPLSDRTFARMMDGKGGLYFILRSLWHTPPFRPRLRTGLVVSLVKSGGQSKLEIKSGSRAAGVFKASKFSRVSRSLPFLVWPCWP